MCLCKETGKQLLIALYLDVFQLFNFLLRFHIISSIKNEVLHKILIDNIPSFIFVYDRIRHDLQVVNRYTFKLI